jgi:hypothetical protein
MKIFVKQDKITIFGRRYVIYEGRRKIYSIRRLWLTPIPKYVIKDSKADQKIGSIRNRFLAFKGDAVISIPNGSFKFDQDGFGSMKYSCKSISNPNEIFELRGHKGHDGSIFKNKEKVGEWCKNKFVIFDGDAYELDLNSDIDSLLMSVLIVLIDTYKISVTVGGDIGWDVGNIGKNLKKKKSGWQPK